MPEPLIQESLRTLGQDDTQALVADLVSLPEVREAARDLVATLSDGTLDALSEPARAERLATAAEAFVVRILGAMAEALDRDLSPAVVSTLARGVDAALEEALSGESRERIVLALSDVADRTIAATAVSVRRELGPALRDTLRDPETLEVLRSTARVIAAEAVRGSAQAVADADAARRAEQGEGGLVDQISSLVSSGGAALDALTVGLLTGILLTVIWFVRRQRRVSRREARAARRESVILALLARTARGSGEELPPRVARALERAIREADDDVEETSVRGHEEQPA